MQQKETARHYLSLDKLTTFGVVFAFINKNVSMENVKRGKTFPVVERPRIYREQLLTIDDLTDFKRQLLFEIKTLFKEQAGQPAKKWLKSKDVRKLLNISPGTLQGLRVKGALPYTRIGGVIYHDADDIARMLESKKSFSRSEL